jgi:WD40 repeat protein
LAELPGHERAISSCTFHPDGETMYLLDRRGRLDRWRFDGRRARHHIGPTPVGTAGRTVSAAYHQVLVTGDGVRLCDGQTLDVVGTLDDRRAATCGAVTADGALIVAGYADGALRAWSGGDTAVPSRTVQLCTTGHHVSGCAIDRAGQRVVASTADGRLHLLDADLRPIHRFDDPGLGVLPAVWACAGSADLDRVVSALTGGVIQLWDARRGTLIGSMSAHAGDVDAVAMSPDGSRVVSAGQDGRLHVWDAELFGNAEPEPFRRLMQHLWLIPDDGVLLAVDAYGIARVWDTRTGNRLAEFVTCERYCGAAATTPDGRTLLVVEHQVGLQVWGLGTRNEHLQALPHPGATIGAFVAGVVVSAGKDDGTVTAWSLGSGRRLWHLNGQRGITTMAPDPDRGRVLVGYTSGATALLDARTGEHTVLRPGGDTEISACIVAARGVLAAGTADGQVLAWAGDRTEITMTDAGHRGRVRHLALGTPRFPIVSAGEDGTIIKWPTHGTTARLSGHDADVRHIGVGDRGRLIVSTSDDRTTRVWDMDSGRQLALLPLQSRGQLVAAHPGEPLFACSDDGGMTTACELRGWR